MPVVRDFMLSLELNCVLRGQGIDPAKVETIPKKILQHTKEMIEEARSLLAPALVYELYPVREMRYNRLVLANGCTLHTRLMSCLLVSAQELAVLVYTIGPDLERKVSSYFARGDSTKGIVLDGVGTAAVEELAQQAHHLIDKIAARRGTKASLSLNPGIGDWDVTEQKVLFGLVRTEKIGVQLTNSCIMVPLKSESAIIGLGDEVITEAEDSVCNHCPQGKSCAYRSRGANEYL